MQGVIDEEVVKDLTVVFGFPSEKKLQEKLARNPSETLRHFTRP